MSRPDPTTRYLVRLLGDHGRTLYQGADLPTAEAVYADVVGPGMAVELVKEERLRETDEARQAREDLRRARPWEYGGIDVHLVVGLLVTWGAVALLAAVAVELARGIGWLP